jgi:hypothetical protein
MDLADEGQEDPVPQPRSLRPSEMAISSASRQGISTWSRWPNGSAAGPAILRASHTTHVVFWHVYEAGA